jgi:PilZ domain
LSADRSIAEAPAAAHAPGLAAIVSHGQRLSRSTPMREQRRYHRVRPSGPAKAGSIFVDLKKPAIGCNVVDISAGGACIEVHGTEAIPARFVLNHGGVKKSCRLVWQKGRRIGVSF